MNDIETAFEDILVEKKLHVRSKNDGLWSLLCLPREFFWPENIYLDGEAYKNAHEEPSPFLSSYNAAPLKNKFSAGSVIVDET